MTSKALQILIIIFFLISCNTEDPHINGDIVSVDDSTFIYTYKENGQRVTGTVAFYTLDSKTTKKYLSELRDIKDGKRVNKGYNYYPSGKMQYEFSYDSDGLITGTLLGYSETGKIAGTMEFKKNIAEGIGKEFSENGIQTKEIIFKNGEIVKEYDFDNQGNKIIPAIEKLELTTYRTGYYEYNDRNRYQTLYQPIVLMRWKNISTEPLEEDIKIEGLFISKGEEWSKETDYFQSYSDIDLQPGLSRQSVLQSNIGYTSPSGIYNGNISCKIFINDKLYKTIKIANKEVMSNRLQ